MPRLPVSNFQSREPNTLELFREILQYPQTGKTAKSKVHSRSRTDSFSFYLQGRGNRAHASAKVVANNETDCVFPGSKIQGASEGNTLLA